jgi:diguanylate cyclase (GGDEF)-like protein
LRLLQTNRRISPLTGLPGNVQIQAEMKKRLLNRERFAVFYFDLDNFKAYNDIYGFSNGDEIIKFTARTIVKNIHSLGLDNSFIGHIGGDDFIAITSVTNFDKICNNIIVDFDTNVLDFYNEEDIKKGYIEVANRRGIIEQFPLTSISIGVVEIDAGRFKNTLEIGEVGAQVKHQAKSVMGSTYVINRRKR